jgi:hypothetical protein
MTIKTNKVALLLRAEGLVILIAAVALYAMADYSWLAFALLFFAPDLALIPYAINRRIGISVYNAVHTFTLPLVLGVAAVLLGWPVGVQVALIWLAHIGMDRAVGYGLKYSDQLKDTHLSRV